VLVVRIFVRCGVVDLDVVCGVGVVVLCCVFPICDILSACLLALLCLLSIPLPRLVSATPDERIHSFKKAVSISYLLLAYHSVAYCT
jgi:hypothetical protein